MKIYKYEFLIDIGNQHDYYKPQATHTMHFLSNTQDNRSQFMGICGKFSQEFLVGESSGWFGYKITEIEVVE